MKTKFFAAITALILIPAILFSISGCAPKTRAISLMENITPNDVEHTGNQSERSVELTDFAVRLFQASQEDSNILISPLSVLYALAMTANGAEGKTLTQMESVLGMNKQDLNNCLYGYLKNLPQTDKCKLNLANSIWFTDDERFTVRPEFLQCNGDYYNADIFKAPFNDDATCKDINNWVNKKTDHMILEILDEVSNDNIMYLINALAFKGEWDEKYKGDQVRRDTFTTLNGTTQSVEFMYGAETAYLEDNDAKGFIKYYKDGKYAFAALLPNETIRLSDYIASLNGAHLHEMLSNPQEISVSTAIPKFESEYSADISDILCNMGMDIAFDSKAADFNALGTSTGGNIYIDKVLHKTYISVGEKGTKAGAAAVVVMTDECAIASYPHSVILDRPFIYMLIDCETNIPFFIGTMTNINQ